MIYVVDTLSLSSQHEQFNTSFLRLLQVTSGKDGITFFGSRSLNNHLERNVSDIKFENVTVYSGRGGIREFIRAIHQFRILTSILRKADIHEVSQFYILLIHPLAHFLFKLFFRSNVQTNVVLHGELESIKFNKHFLNKVWGAFLKPALIKNKACIRYIILGESIYKNLLDIIPSFNAQEKIILDHPYPFTNKHTVRKIGPTIVFSCLGVAGVQKNSQYFFEVAEKIARAALSHRSKFNICGMVFKNMAPYLNKHVNYKKINRSLSREEVDMLLDESHFAVFYYDNDNYSLCPSGAFWDAINAELPLLYVKNDYFKHYSDLVGQIGIVFDSPEALNKYIIDLISNGTTPANYDEFIGNIRTLKYSYMNEQNLSNQLNRLS